MSQPESKRFRLSLGCCFAIIVVVALFGVFAPGSRDTRRREALKMIAQQYRGVESKRVEIALQGHLLTKQKPSDRLRADEAGFIYICAPAADRRASFHTPAGFLMNETPSWSAYRAKKALLFVPPKDSEAWTLCMGLTMFRFYQQAKDGDVQMLWVRHANNPDETLPALREAWGKVPPDMRDRITKELSENQKVFEKIGVAGCVFITGEGQAFVDNDPEARWILEMAGNNFRFRQERK